MCIVNNYIFNKEIYRLSHYYMFKITVFFQSFDVDLLTLTSSTAARNATNI